MEGKILYNSLLKKISNYCVVRERSEKEVDQKLIDLAIPEDERQHIIGLLKKENLLNEERYTLTLVNSKFRNYHWGRIKIREHLEYQNIKKEIIERVIQGIPADEYLSAATMLIKKSKSPQSAYLSLINKGYEEEIVTEILHRIGWNEL